MPDKWTWDQPEIMGPRNRRVLAVRLGYPPHSVGVCERVETVFSARPDDGFAGLTVSWLNENPTPGFAGPAGFYASPVGVSRLRGWRAKAAYGTTEAELVTSCAALLDRLAHNDAWGNPVKSVRGSR